MGIYDLIIVGAGPAGLTAAIYASRARLDFIVIEKAPLNGGQIMNTESIDNYPGIPGVSGFELAKKFSDHALGLGAAVTVSENIKLRLTGSEKVIELGDKSVLKAKCVVIATGSEHKKLGVAGEKELAGAGVSYCATCDGAFFRKRTVCVVGGGDVALGDALFLSRIASKVYIIHRRSEFRGAKTYVEALSKLPAVEFVYDSAVDSINGSGQVESVSIHNVENGVKRDIECSGVFIAVGEQPSCNYEELGIKVDGNGYIIAGEDTKTSLPGVFAAGDIRTKKLRQVVTAAADGANAIESVQDFLRG